MVRTPGSRPASNASRTVGIDDGRCLHHGIECGLDPHGGTPRFMTPLAPESLSAARGARSG